MRETGRMSKMAQRARERGEPSSWFEELYREGDVPWADGVANPWLIDWLSRHAEPGQEAVVVGCGFGDDAEALATAGYSTSAFDLAPTAIASCRERFPHSSVDYRVADARELPPDWRRRFGLVFECYTLQALQGTIRREVAASVARLVAPGGRLLLVSRGREPTQRVDGPPWPLSLDELAPFASEGLVLERHEDFVDPYVTGVRRFRSVWVRSASR